MVHICDQYSSASAWYIYGTFDAEARWRKEQVKEEWHEKDACSVSGIINAVYNSDSMYRHMEVNETSRVAFSRGLINGSYSQHGWRTP